MGWELDKVEDEVSSLRLFQKEHTSIMIELKEQINTIELFIESQLAKDVFEGRQDVTAAHLSKDLLMLQQPTREKPLRPSSVYQSSNISSSGNHVWKELYSEFSWENKYTDKNNHHFSVRKLQLQQSFFAIEENTVCGGTPILAPINTLSDFKYDERVDIILEVIYSVSTMAPFIDFNSPQYKATCWIIYEDSLKLSPENELFLERYILALFLYEMNVDAGTLISVDTCEYDMVVCNNEGKIIELHWSKN